MGHPSKFSMPSAASGVEIPQLLNYGYIMLSFCWSQITTVNARVGSAGISAHPNHKSVPQKKVL